ncbi:MAG: hypothetical protein U0517_03965 [Candidatus Andersenbacteria bacterium]
MAETTTALKLVKLSNFPRKRQLAPGDAIIYDPSRPSLLILQGAGSTFCKQEVELSVALPVGDLAKIIRALGLQVHQRKGDHLGKKYFRVF